MARKLAFIVTLLLNIACVAESRDGILVNNYLRAEFGPRGLRAVSDNASGKIFHIQSDNFALIVDGILLESSGTSPVLAESSREQRVYRYEIGNYTVLVKYQLHSDWRFVAKQLLLTRVPARRFRVNRITVVDSSLQDTIMHYYKPTNYTAQFGGANLHGPAKDYGVFLRMPDSTGVMMIVQNPFLEPEVNGSTIKLSYAPEMDWDIAYGAFASDIACLGIYPLSSMYLPDRMVPEWKPSSKVPQQDGADRAEVAAFTDCVRAFILNPPSDPSDVEVGWTLNDYQINVATAEGREEYKRVINTASELGVTHLLYAPENTDLADRHDSIDDWSWEYVLWLGLGEKIRKGEWDVHTGEIPATIREMVDYARSKNILLLAYVYPSLPFVGDKSWLVSMTGKHKYKQTATLASRSFQDYLIDLLTTFLNRTGIGGYSFDYSFLTYPENSSYAQWWGWRRVLQTLRHAMPRIVIDGRQSYQLYGPWSWLGGTYPHPTGTDEQPESFTPFPDLHFDRVSADRLRYVNYWYRNYQFAPTELIPGYITHQTERSRDMEIKLPDGKIIEKSEMMWHDYRLRDWDYLGWKYSLISSIGTAGWNNVVNMIPARDMEEYQHFSDPDKRWFRDWLRWTTEHKELLRHTRSILDSPAIGNVDGTSAIMGDHGYVFLFNPNYKQHTANIKLDSSIGLAGGSSFTIREIYPRNGVLIGKTGAGYWAFGDNVSVTMDGTSAVVYEIDPASPPTIPIIFNTDGTALLTGSSLELRGATGEIGTSQEILVQLPDQREIKEFHINGHSAPFHQQGPVVAARVRFVGSYFRHSSEVPWEYSCKQILTGTFSIPSRVLEQLQARQKAWPIAWSKEDYNTTWLAPERLLLFLQVAEPKEDQKFLLKIDGHPVLLVPAYSSVRAHAPSLVGWYADLSKIQPDMPHRVVLELPALESGQFQGIFFDNVETEYTDQVQFP